MAENEGDDDIDFESITSSQRSLLKNCPFSDSESHLLLQPSSPTKSHGGGERDTDSYTTEILETPISTTVVQTPIISFSSPTSLDSINDEDVFRTPPENASLSSAADSEPAFRVSAIKSKSKSPSFETHTTPFYVSPSLTPGNVRVPETKSKSKSPSSEANRTPLYTSPSRTPGNVRVSATKSKSPSSETDTSPFSASPFVTPGNVRVSATKSKSPYSETGTMPFSASPYSETGTMPFSASPSLTPGNVRILETNRLSDFVEPVTEEMLPSPPYFAAEVVRFPILSSQPYNAAVDFGVPISSPPSIAAVDVRITETDNISEEETPIPFKEIIEALLRNNGENINERDDSFSFVEALKKCGLKFP